MLAEYRNGRAEKSPPDMVSTQCSSQSSNAVWSLAISMHICCDLDNAPGRKARHLRTSRGGAVASLLETTGRSRRHTAIYDALCIAYPYFQNATYRVALAKVLPHGQCRLRIGRIRMSSVFIPQCWIFLPLRQKAASCTIAGKTYGCAHARVQAPFS